MPAPTDRQKPIGIWIYTNFNVHVRLADGREFRGKAREYDDAGEKRYFIPLAATVSVGRDASEQEKDAARQLTKAHEVDVSRLRQKFELRQFEGRERPSYFHERSKVEPLKVNLRWRESKGKKFLIGELWAPTGESGSDDYGLWTVLASRATKSTYTLYAGSIVPAREELDNPHSKIAQYRGAEPGADVADAHLPAAMAEITEHGRQRAGAEPQGDFAEPPWRSSEPDEHERFGIDDMLGGADEVHRPDDEEVRQGARHGAGVSEPDPSRIEPGGGGVAGAAAPGGEEAAQMPVSSSDAGADEPQKPASGNRPRSRRGERRPAPGETT